MAVSLELRNAAAIVWLDNPPVNAIGVAIRQGLMDTIAKIAADPAIERVVLCGRGSIFAAGADAREFDGDPIPPHLPEAIAAMEASDKCWIAAIDGAALGGGAELALGCRVRLASRRATIGFPETTLGAIPGAGGTQRLPRLVGFEQALQLVPQGKVVKAGEALAIGLVDQVVDDPLTSALEMDLADYTLRPALSLVLAPKTAADAIEDAKQLIAKRMRGQIAPKRAIEIMVAGSTLPFGEAMARERACFLELRQGEQAKALRHLFFAERAAKVPASLTETAPVTIEQAVIVGGGTMGSGIAYALDRAGIGVLVVETDQDGCERATANIAKLIAGAQKRGLLDDEAARQAKERLVVQRGFDGLENCSLAIEAAFEDMAVKKSIFAQLAKALPDRAILATNTSYLDVDDIAASIDDPTRVVGMHFFSPAHIMKLLEIVRGKISSDTALATAFVLAKRLRKIPVLAGVCDGFIGNRILMRYREAADMLLMDGATPWEIDEAMVEFGYPMGPYEAQDLSGLDIAFANRQRQAPMRDPKRRYIPIADRMVNEGRLGRKTGVGWYRYPGGSGPVVDPLIEDLIAEEAHFAKVIRREIGKDEIRDRLLTAMINEAFAILDDGIAQSPTDIDLVSVHGYGFPRWRGGLMHYAQALGLDVVAARLAEYGRDDPIVWRPSPTLARLGDAA